MSAPQRHLRVVPPPRQASPPLRLTRRGKAVVAIAVIATVWALSNATNDICWTGGGYGSCEQMNEANRKKSQP